jgi:hypothetical protein
VKLIPEHTCTHLACTPANCNLNCALEVVDGLLRATHAVRGEEMDSLLDLRSLLRRREDPEATLASFCQLRRSMEDRHYLSFYRLRRWLENQIQVCISSSDADNEAIRIIPLRLNRYCLEAVRGQCFQTALAYSPSNGIPRVRFVFQPLVTPAIQPALMTLALDASPL